MQRVTHGGVQDFGQHLRRPYMIVSTGKFPRNSLQLKCLEEDARVGGREKRGGSEAVLR